ncbi:MAG: EF-hand domain-containing protein [Geminicoccaceae bacterium]
MIKTSRLLMTTGAVALGATVLAGATLAGGGHHGRGHQGGAWLFENFDANDDGRITQVEIEEVRQGQLEEFDADGDGSLSLEEYQALWLDAMRERMVDRFQAHDDDGDGLVTVAEFGERFDGIISHLDDDGDGELTMDELRSRHRDRDRGDDRD